MRTNNRLSIVIVVFHNANDLVQCISSLYAQLSSAVFEVIIVSNGFEEEAKKMLLRNYPEVIWIEMQYNAGFARANNEGIKAAKGDAVLLLNPDTIALNDDIIKCYQQLSDSSFIAAGVQLLDKEGMPQISGSFFVKGGLNHLLPLPYWGDFIRWIGYKAKTKVPNVQQSKPVEEVDWISGAFLMVKRTAIDKAGLMDEDFFLYAEEVEWCSRLKKIGQLVIFGDLEIVHLEGASINRSQNITEKGYYNLYDRKGLQLMVSNHLRVRKQYGIGWFLILLLNYTFGVFVFAIVGMLHRLFTASHPFAHGKKVAAFAKNVMILWRLSPRMIRNQPYFYKMF